MLATGAPVQPPLRPGQNNEDEMTKKSTLMGQKNKKPLNPCRFNG
jgi:hypothetical protein